MGVESLFNLLPSHWEVVTLGEACKRGGGDIQTGPFGSQLHASDYVPVGIPSIMPKNIGENRVDITDIARIRQEDAQRLNRYLVKPGDIVYSRRGDVERRALIRDEEEGWLCGTGCLRVRLGEEIADPLYASYYLGHPVVRQWIVRHAVGATMPNLNTSILSSLPFVLPPLDEQKAIAHILGTLDDKIELNQQMNRTLEAIAHALFKSWFIDFDPVRAKLDGRQPAGMDAETAALFPAEFEDSELGQIPKGWEIKTSQSIFSVKDGTHDSPKVSEFGYPLVTSRHLKNGFIDFDNTYLISEEDFYEVNKRSKVDKNDILITMIGTVGNIFLVDYEEIDFAIKNVGLFKASENPELAEYFYFYLRSESMENYLKVRQSGTTQSYITLKTLRTLPVLLPSEQLIRVFRRYVSPLLQRITANREEANSLVSIRSSLLPKLLSGEIRVKDAEKVLEEVA